MVKYAQTTSKEEVPTPVMELDRQKAQVNSSLLVVESDVFGSNCHNSLYLDDLT